MKRLPASFILAVLIAISGLAAGPKPQVVYSQEKISINVDGMTLGSLLRLWDEATGMHSTVPPALANQKVSINFSGLTLSESVRRIFEKLPFDYVFIVGRGVVVTAISRPGEVAEAAPVYMGEPEVTTRLLKPEPAPPPVVKQPPPMINTPFGPIPDRGGNAFVQLPPVPGEAPSPPFFRPRTPPPPPSGAPNGPAQNELFGPISIY
jgi:hypothetical protein